MTREWRDLYDYSVAVRRTPWGPSKHLKVWRRDGRDGIPWDDLQRIKNEVLGEESCAVEFYPPEAKLANSANARHLWTVPFPPPLRGDFE